LVAGRLQDLKDYLTSSDDADVNSSSAGQRSVKLKLEMTRDTSQKTIRVLKKEKKVIGLHEAMAYINSACERSEELLASYFPSNEDDPNYEREVTLTLRVIIKPLLVNKNALAKTYMVSYPAVSRVYL
jgi:hypothetical protein